MTDPAAIPGERICSFIERVERIDEEIKALNEGKKEVFSEAKGEGFDVKVLKEILRLRKQDQDERDEQSRCSTCISGRWRARAHRKHRRLKPSHSIRGATWACNHSAIPSLAGQQTFSRPCPIGPHPSRGRSDGPVSRTTGAAAAADSVDRHKRTISSCWLAAAIPAVVNEVGPRRSCSVHCAPLSCRHAC